MNTGQNCRSSLHILVMRSFQCEIERSVGVRVSYRTLRTGEAQSAHSLIRAGRTRACSRTNKWATVRRSARAPCRAPSAETCSPQCEPAVRALTVGLCQHSPPHISGVDRWGFSCWLLSCICEWVRPLQQWRCLGKVVGSPLTGEVG